MEAELRHGDSTLPPVGNILSRATADSNELPIPPSEGKRINPFMMNINLLQGNVLKTTEKYRFAHENLSLTILNWKKNLTERMRALDDLRMRTPTEEECSDLNIPNDRLNFHSVQNILLLCGGCVGIRFTSEELQQLVSLSGACETHYLKIDLSFKALHQAARTRRLKGPYSSDSNNEHTSLKSSSSSPSGPSLLKPEEEIGRNAACTLHNEDFDAVDIVSVHCSIDSYIRLIKEIQVIVQKKNETLLSKTEREEKGLQNFERDPDNISAAGNPIWLSVLMEKFERNKLDCTTPESTLNNVFTIGKFSAFLSCCSEGLIPCRSEEKDSFIVLLQASNDSEYKYSSEEEDPVTFIRKVQASCEDNLINSQKYFASRFFNFLGKLTELKSTPMDAKSIHAFSAYLK